jgi:hypothetical protein
MGKRENSERERKTVSGVRAFVRICISVTRLYIYISPTIGRSVWSVGSLYVFGFRAPAAEYKANGSNYIDIP